MPITRQGPPRTSATFAVILSLVLGALALLPAATAQAQGFTSVRDKEPVAPRIIAQNQSIQPGQTLTIAVHFDLADKWHLYWTNPAGPGYAPGVEWDLPAGYSVSQPRWPAPHTFDSFGNQQFGYENQLTLLYDLTAPEDADGQAQLKASLTWLVCDDKNCFPNPGYPKGIERTLTLPVSEDAPEPSDDKPLIEAAQKTLPRPAPGWSFDSRAIDEGFELTITAPSEADAEALDGLFFYSAQPLVVDYKAGQEVTVDGKTVTMRFTERTTNEVNKPIKRDTPITELSGVLTAESGFGDSGIKAVPIGSYGKAEQPADSAGAKEGSATGENGQASGGEQPGVAAPSGGDQAPGFLAALGLAFVGGIILNLMPCVFPVLSIKILGFVKGAGENPAIVRRHGYAFGIGVLLSFWVLVGVLLALRGAAVAAGADASTFSWGYQMQNPAFVLAMIVLIFLIGLNLIGTFEIGIGLSAAAGRASQSVATQGYSKSFFTGVLASIIATPCTGPLMAPALGAALAMPLVQALLVFTALGVGMALPYVVLSCFPALLNYLPRPGAWMESFKQAMAFPMFATAGVGVWIYADLTDDVMIAVLLIALTIVALGAWVYGRWGTPMRSNQTRWIARAAALVLVVGGIGFSQATASGIEQARQTMQQKIDAGEYVAQWVPYSEDKIAALQADNRPVLVDFTARWCAICQANKISTLRTGEAERFYEQHNVALMEADFTRHDPAIGKTLEKYDRGGVPLYLVFPAGGGEPEVLPNTLTPGIVKDAIRRATKDAPADKSPQTAGR